MATEIDTRSRPNNGYALFEEMRKNFERVKDALQEVTAATARYTHEQSLASASWVVAHNLNRKPQVTVVDSANTVVFGRIEYVDDNTLTLLFSAPFSGKAYLV